MLNLSPYQELHAQAMRQVPSKSVHKYYFSSLAWILKIEEMNSAHIRTIILPRWVCRISFNLLLPCCGPTLSLVSFATPSLTYLPPCYFSSSCCRFPLHISVYPPSPLSFISSFHLLPLLCLHIFCPFEEDQIQSSPHSHFSCLFFFLAGSIYPIPYPHSSFCLTQFFFLGDQNVTM